MGLLDSFLGGVSMKDPVTGTPCRTRASAQGSAEAIAAARRGEGGGAAGMGGAQVINLSGGDLSQLSDDQLQKLADLKERGALTEQEFEAEKKKLLGD